MNKFPIQNITSILNKSNYASTKSPYTICITPTKNNLLGDFVMQNHLLQHFKLNHPDIITIYAISEKCSQQFEPFFKDFCLVDKQIVLKKGLFNIITFIFKLKKLKVDAVLFDVEPVIRPIIFSLSGIRNLIGPDSVRTFLFTKKYHIDKRNTHYSKYYSLACNWLNINPGIRHIKPYFPSKQKNIPDFIKRPILSVHIGGYSYWMRKWPKYKYEVILRQFLKQYSGTIFLIGGDDEYVENEDLKNILISENKQYEVYNFCGRKLNETANYIGMSDLFVGNDSGPLHIATALHTKVIGIFGPSAIECVSPQKYNSENATVISDLVCAPCLSFNCSYNSKFACLNELPTELVWDKVIEFLK